MADHGGICCRHGESAGSRMSVTPLAADSVRAVARRLAPHFDTPSSLAEAVLAEIGDDPARLVAALHESLPAYVADLIRGSRNRTITGRSAKVSGIRDWHKRFLAELLHTESGWRQIGACTASDLLFAAEERRVHAAKELCRAAQYEALAARLADAGVETVADLPESDVRDALDAAA